MIPSEKNLDLLMKEETLMKKNTGQGLTSPQINSLASANPNRIASSPVIGGDHADEMDCETLPEQAETTSLNKRSPKPTNDGKSPTIISTPILEKHTNTDQPPFMVHIKDLNTTPMHLLHISRILTSQFPKGMGEVTKIGRGHVAVAMNTLTDANKLIGDRMLEAKGLHAYAPSYRLYRIGTIKGIPQDLDIPTLKSNIKSTHKIKDINRLNKRTNTDGKISYEPSRTLSIKFSGQTLPRNIFIYNIKYSVFPFIPKIKICYACFRVGHISAQCKGKARCIHCGAEKHPDKSYKCPASLNPPICINCKRNHLPTSHECTIITNIKKYRHYKKETKDSRSPIRNHPGPEIRLQRFPPPETISRKRSQPISPISAPSSTTNPPRQSSSQPTHLGRIHRFLLTTTKSQRIIRIPFNPKRRNSIGLSITQWNCKGLSSKLPEFSNNTSAPDVWCEQETLLKNNKYLNLPGYSVLRNDADDAGSLGIAFLIKKGLDFNTQPVAIPRHSSCEIAAISLKTNKEPLLIINIYRHTNQDTPLDYIQSVVATLTITTKYFLVVGDINAHHPAWGDSRTDAAGKRFQEAFDEENLVILSTSGNTFMSLSTGSFSSIDVAVASPALAPYCVTVVDTDLRGSDHFPVHTIARHANPKRTFRHRIRLSATELRELKARMEASEHDFSREFPLDPIQGYEHIVKFVQKEIRELIGDKRSACGPKIPNKTLNHEPALWWTDECTDSCRVRRAALQTYRRDPTAGHLAAYKDTAAICSKTLRTHKRKGWKDLCASFNGNTPSSQMWGFLRSYKNKMLGMVTPRSVRPPESLETQQARAKDNLCPPSCEYRTDIDTLLKEFNTRRQMPTATTLGAPITLEEINWAFESTRKGKTAPGLDQIDFGILSSFPPFLIQSLLNIYNKILERGISPPDWSRAMVILIPKPHGGGFRPISLLPCLLKIMEKCLYLRLSWYVEKFKLLPDAQHGFRRGRSCGDSLAILATSVKSFIARGERPSAVFLDIAAAFDNIDPIELMRSLIGMGVPINLCKFIFSYLASREVRFVEDGELSGPRWIYKGTPQGSILSNLLFSIYLRELPDCIPHGVNILQYADDLAIWASGRDRRSVVDLLSTTTGRIDRFLRGRGLELSVSKSTSINFGKSTRQAEDVERVSLNGSELPLTGEHRFLGINIDYAFSGKIHLVWLTKKCRVITNVISSLAGVWWGSHPALLINIYRAVMRSTIKYDYQISFFRENLTRLGVLLRLRNRALRSAMGYRKSTPINVLLSETKEPPLHARLDLLNIRFLYRNLTRSDGLLANSLEETGARLSCYKERTWILQNNPIMRTYIKIREDLTDIDGSRTEGPDRNLVGAGIFSPELQQHISQRLPDSASIFFAEAWAIVGALKMCLSEGAHFTKAIILSDSRSVPDAINSLDPHHRGHLVPLIRNLAHKTKKGIEVTCVWIPSHKGIDGNEEAGRLARNAASDEEAARPDFRAPYSDFYTLAREGARSISDEYFRREFEVKGKLYHQYVCIFIITFGLSALIPGLGLHQIP
ncbi:PREDICTED: LOW QUALITY PROTEIN: RNA-directed DNA polymerase from mobile element jockey-like [Vollenhovia emeryi]|uniref:LOW QUALITY PROTEIN: RNA-directed DNA polymerase from mobile element jockey-like n=1 Tax=Vollenhovia emeryi TaxID=411798 RepID=UPI0005F41D56|nr:PREDICTED: LOW QUALITY PROTEIN: RNA-directed DNA polymerase from mobile element jockey-like [Vollenhovia emeryi]